MPGLHLLLGGFGAGVAMAVPVGPVAALCVSLTLRRGSLHGMLAGFGAAVGDSLLCAAAVFGLAGAHELLEGHQAWFRLAAGVLLGIVALVRSTPRAPEPTLALRRPALHSSFLGPLLLTLTNPATILSFAAVLGALDLPGLETPGDGAPWVVLGSFLGAFFWWLLVTMVAGRWHRRTAPDTLARFDRMTTLLLALLAVALVLSGLVELAS